MTELYKLPQGTPVRILDSEGKKRDATFHYIDGMYSYCTFDDEVLIPGRPRQPFHIKAWTEMVEVDERWEVVAQKEAAEGGSLVTGGGDESPIA